MLGRRTARRTPTGARTEWQYGASPRPRAMRTAGRTMSFDYDSAGNETERLLSTGTSIAQSWDANHRLSTQTVTSGSADAARQGRLIQQRRYHYRQDGHLTAVDDHLAGSRSYELDHAARITAVVGSGWTERYAYDASGNITAAAGGEEQTADVGGPWEYDGITLLRAGNTRYQYDRQGRITLRQRKRLSAKPATWRYEWQADDRLVGVVTPDGTRWRYHYDPLGRRVAKLRLSSSGEVAERIGAALPQSSALRPGHRQVCLE